MFLQYGRHVGQHRRRRRRPRRRAYAPTSNTASHDNHEKMDSWVSFSFLYEYGALLAGRRRSAIKSLALSQLVYPASNLNVPQEITPIIKTKLLNFYGKTKTTK